MIGALIIGLGVLWLVGRTNNPAIPVQPTVTAPPPPIAGSDLLAQTIAKIAALKNGVNVVTGVPLKSSAPVEVWTNDTLGSNLSASGAPIVAGVPETTTAQVTAVGAPAAGVPRLGGELIYNGQLGTVVGTPQTGQIFIPSVSIYNPTPKPIAAPIVTTSGPVAELPAAKPVQALDSTQNYVPATLRLNFKVQDVTA